MVETKGETRLRTAQFIVTIIVAVVTAALTYSDISLKNQLATRDEALKLQLQTRDEQLQLQLAAQDEQLQLGLVQMGEEAKRQSGLAHLQIEEYHWIGSGNFGVQNLGPAIAKDVKVVLTLWSIDAEWVDTITDIGKLNVHIFPPTLDVTVITKTVVTGGTALDSVERNAFELVIPSLPPGTTAILWTPLGAGLENNTSVTRTAELFLGDQSRDSISEWDALDLLPSYFRRQFPLVTFKVDAHCSNCEGNVGESIAVSALNYVEIHDTEVLSEVPPGVSYPFFDKITPGWRATVTISYATPTGVAHTPDTGLVRLVLGRPGDSGEWWVFGETP